MQLEVDYSKTRQVCLRYESEETATVNVAKSLQHFPNTQVHIPWAGFVHPTSRISTVGTAVFRCIYRR